MQSWLVVGGVLSLILLASALRPQRMLRIAGASSLAPLAEAAQPLLGTAFGPGRVAISTLGTAFGYTAVQRGTADIALLDLPLRAGGFALQPIARLRLAVIGRPPAGTRLTSALLRDILCGRVRDWRLRAGGREPIALVMRQSGSGVRRRVEQFAGCALPPRARQALSNGQLVRIVRGLPGSLGVVESSYAPRGLTLALDGLEPTAGAYPLAYQAYAFYRRGDVRAALAADLLRDAARRVRR